MNLKGITSFIIPYTPKASDSFIMYFVGDNFLRLNKMTLLIYIFSNKRFTENLLWSLFSLLTMDRKRTYKDR